MCIVTSDLHIIDVSITTEVICDKKTTKITGGY